MSPISKILIIMPTRGRMHSALQAIASIIENADHPDRLQIVVCHDHDDPQWFAINSANVSTMDSPRRSFVSWVNYAVCSHMGELQDYSHVAWMGDDVRYGKAPAGHGWDTILRRKAELVVHGCDGYQNNDLATHPFVRTEIIWALGVMIPPELCHYYPDNFMTELGRGLESIRYDNWLMTIHYHPDAGHGIPRDELYDETHAAYWQKDTDTWNNIVKPQMPDYIRKVKDRVKAQSKKD